MDNPPDPTARQIRRYLEPLVAQVAHQLQDQLPWYQALDPPVLWAMISADYQALAMALATQDLVAFRRYVEQSGEERLRASAPAAIRLAAIGLLDAAVQPLLTGAEYGDGPRRLQNLTRNMRMILSGVNLRLLNEARPPPRGGPD